MLRKMELSSDVVTWTEAFAVMVARYNGNKSFVLLLGFFDIQLAIS